MLKAEEEEEEGGGGEYIRGEFSPDCGGFGFGGYKEGGEGGGERRGESDHQIRIDTLVAAAAVGRERRGP